MTTYSVDDRVRIKKDVQEKVFCNYLPVGIPDMNDTFVNEVDNDGFYFREKYYLGSSGRAVGWFSKDQIEPVTLQYDPKQQGDTEDDI